MPVTQQQHLRNSSLPGSPHQEPAEWSAWHCRLYHGFWLLTLVVILFSHSERV
ncbi:unnamed protein product, partial [Scytosiphon promiscuus]